MRLSLFVNRQTEHVMSYLSPLLVLMLLPSWRKLKIQLEPSGLRIVIRTSSGWKWQIWEEKFNCIELDFFLLAKTLEAKTLEEMSETNQSCLTKNDKVNVKRYSTTSNQFERHQRVHFVCKQLPWGLLACQQPEATMRDTKDLLLSKLHQKHFRLTRSDAPRRPVVMKASKKVTKALPPNSFA